MEPMPEVMRPRFSYRSDPSVPAFDDSKALFVFDGVCVLCSGGAAWLMRHDRHGRVNFASAQSAVGQELYKHYGMKMDDSYLLIHDGGAYTASRGYLQLFTILGGFWKVLRVGQVIPESWRDGAYAMVARNRYRWFGKVEYCTLLTDEQRRRLL
jgi:predicted DCC family thiol-disulfide oxidoreductase YuxK